MAAVRHGWQVQAITPLVSKVIMQELIRVLAYPKFRLTAAEQEDLLSDYLPYCETVTVARSGLIIPTCRDPYDVPFFELALAGHADYLVTGDSDLLALESEFSCPTLTVQSLLTHVGIC